MRELEVRLALVCFGGASLAVYMNGVSHEILKLVRASKVYHDLSKTEKAEPEVTYTSCAPAHPYHTDTEEVYFELLREIGKTIDVRVVVDVISGASAGGINGIFLARALAFDLDFDPLRDMWMRLGDIEELMEEETLAQRWSKIYMYPILWLFGDRIWDGEKTYSEARRKLSRFIRSRWFEPPFSGTRMLKWMLDANANMGEAKPGTSLMPRGHQLDLFVSLTNFYGQKQTVGLHDPKTIEEQQHKVSLRFSHTQGRRSARQSDFDDTNIPGLGFAARATSSFPGAFPPVRLQDLKDYLRQNGLPWAHENEFMTKNFGDLSEDHLSVRDMAFIDGGVTNNKPFSSAIEAINNKPAHREVDRRVIFVDPRPEVARQKTEPHKKDKSGVPGFFKTILASIAAIPRDEPILEDLKDIETNNRNARRLERVMERIDLDVAELVDKILLLEPGAKVSTAMLASWRERAHEEAHKESGFAYGSYMENKAAHLVERLSRFLIEFRKHRDLTTENATGETVSDWAETKGFLSAGDKSCRNAIPFFRGFDVDFRVRRLRFLIKRLNIYLQDNPQIAEQISFRGLKSHIYDSIARYRERWQPSFYGSVPHDWPLEQTLDAVAAKMALEDLDMEEDKMLADAINDIADEPLRVTLFRAYVGYAFYDVLTLPMTAHTDLQEIDEVRVDRISPLDCEHLHTDGKSPLMGEKLFNFGAFFSRRARENDYIWGRIHAANRLVDFLCDAAGPEAVCKTVDVEKIRRRLAHAIVETEKKHNEASSRLIKRLEQEFGA